MYHLSNYDYPPYNDSTSASEPEPTSLPGNGNDTQNTKVRIYQLTAINPSVFVYAADHPHLNIKECLVRRRAKLGKIKAPFSDNLALQLSLDCWDSKAVVPMYPPRPTGGGGQGDGFIGLTSSLPENSYVSVSLRLMQLSSRLLVTGKGQGITWLQPSTLYLKFNILSLSDLSSEVGGSFEADSWKLRLSRDTPIFN